MTKYILLTVIFINLIWAQDEKIKNDNTIIINVDDFSISTQYPAQSNNPKELSLIIRNNSKEKYLFTLKKNNQNSHYISIPAQESYSRTISIGQNEIYALRPLSPPSEDIKLNNLSKNEL